MPPCHRDPALDAGVGNLVAVATVVLGTREGIQTPSIRRIPSIPFILFIPVNNAPNANDFGKQLEGDTAVDSYCIMG